MFCANSIVFCGILWSYVVFCGILWCSVVKRRTAIPVVTFGGVDRGSEVEVVAGAHVYPADPIGVQWDSSSAIWKAMEAHWCCSAQAKVGHWHCYTRCMWPSVVLLPSVGMTPSVCQLRAWGKVGSFRLCTLQSLHFPEHALGLFCGHLR